MSEKESLLDVVQLVETLGTTGVRSPQVSILWGAVKHIWQGPREIPLLHSLGRSKVPSDIQQATIEAYNFLGVKRDIELKADMLSHWLDRAVCTFANSSFYKEA
ncbi:hypothetical protein FXO38_36239 [Capsicum annuum]|nr:hypothetical protein FXO38_36239 [Capsicum annuum]KAF3618239.1 hypothetical protein FXO37_34275 [Capsicum annuum]